MKKTLKITAITILIIALILGCEDFLRRKIGGFAGSYPYVSTWELDGSEEDVLRAIVRMKVGNPELQVPADSNLLDGKSGYWTFAKFYYKDTGQTLKTWTRPESGHKTTFALVFFKDATRWSEPKYINRDFLLWDNIREKRKFESLIVEPLKRNLEVVKIERVQENYWIDSILVKERIKD